MNAQKRIYMLILVKKERIELTSAARLIMALVMTPVWPSAAPRASPGNMYLHNYIYMKWWCLWYFSSQFDKIIVLFSLVVQYIVITCWCTVMMHSFPSLHCAMQSCIFALWWRHHAVYVCCTGMIQSCLRWSVMLQS